MEATIIFIAIPIHRIAPDWRKCTTTPSSHLVLRAMLPSLGTTSCGIDYILLYSLLPGFHKLVGPSIGIYLDKKCSD